MLAGSLPSFFQTKTLDPNTEQLFNNRSVCSRELAKEIIGLREKNIQLNWVKLNWIRKIFLPLGCPSCLQTPQDVLALGFSQKKIAGAPVSNVIRAILQVSV